MPVYPGAPTTPSDSLSTADPFPAELVIGRHASRRPQRRGRGGPPQFPGQPSDRSTPLTPEGPSTPAPESQVSSVAFTVAESARLPLDHPKVVAFDDACAGFARAADRPVAPPCSAPGISATHEGFTTEDSGVSSDRRSGAVSRMAAARVYVSALSSIEPDDHWNRPSRS